MKNRQIFITTAVSMAFILFSGCGNDTGSKKSPVTSLEIVYLSDITVGRNQILISWIDPASSCLDHVELTYTYETVTLSLEFDPGIETCLIASIPENTEYTFTLTAADCFGNFSDPNTFTLTTTSGSTIEYTKIGTAEELNNTRNNLDGCYLLTADIDLNGYSSGEGWVPIGTESSNFTGCINGNMRVITNLKINRYSEYQALIGYTGSASRIESLGLENVDVYGAFIVGGLAGMNYGTISNSYV